MNQDTVFTFILTFLSGALGGVIVAIVNHFLIKKKTEAEINKIGAGHRSVFIAGWRPCCGWICCSALAWGWIIAPTLQFIFPGRELPAIEVGQAISLIMAMLGMGALRSYEKKKGLTE